MQIHNSGFPAMLFPARGLYCPDKFHHRFYPVLIFKPLVKIVEIVNRCIAYPVKLQRQRFTGDNLGCNVQQGKLYKRHIRHDRIDIYATRQSRFA